MENENKKPTEPNTAEDLVQRATEAAERLEKATAEARALEAKKILGGQSEGKPQEEPKKELTPAEYAAQVSQGIIPTE
jgi:hypothetical protein